MTASDRFFSPRQSLSLLLAMLLLPWNIPAQDRNKPAMPRNAGLKIYVLAGSGAVNFIPDQHATTPVVEVRDDNELPVAGVTVQFDLPGSGPGGDFPNGQHTFSAITNVSGQALAPFIVRPQPGSFQIRVSATIDTRSASAAIVQVNSLKPSEAGGTATAHRHWYKNWKVLAIIGAAGVVTGVLLATRGGSSSSAASIPSVGITPGNPTYGAPH